MRFFFLALLASSLFASLAIADETIPPGLDVVPSSSTKSSPNYLSKAHSFNECPKAEDKPDSDAIINYSAERANKEFYQVKNIYITSSSRILKPTDQSPNYIASKGSISEKELCRLTEKYLSNNLPPSIFIKGCADPKTPGVPGKFHSCTMVVDIKLKHFSGEFFSEPNTQDISLVQITPHRFSNMNRPDWYLDTNAYIASELSFPISNKGKQDLVKKDLEKLLALHLDYLIGKIKAE